jgi:hypothetical protein
MGHHSAGVIGRMMIDRGPMMTMAACVGSGRGRVCVLAVQAQGYLYVTCCGHTAWGVCFVVLCAPSAAGVVIASSIN